VWHEQTRQWVTDGKLTVIGVVQEQHAERTRLYRQWRQFDWPIAQDSLNLLQVKVVPIPIAIDENGIVCSHQADPKFLERWLAKPVEPVVDDRKPATPVATIDAELQTARNAILWQRMADSAGLDQALDIYESLLASNHLDIASTHFEAAVAFRDRFDISGDASDFRNSIEHWSRALELDPNQYIYRRRIQQYGPRLDKPYPFYDWIEQARTEIRARGETPFPLTVALGGAEIAAPLPAFDSATEVAVNPDPGGAILRDDEDLVDVQVVVVPPRIAPGQSARIHLGLQPAVHAKWNNEAGPTRVWFNETPDVQWSARLVDLPLPESIESVETRWLEVEVQLPAEVSGPVSVSGYVLFNICRDDTGVCNYLRRDFEFELVSEN
jgi:hypothetical protein